MKETGYVSALLLERYHLGEVSAQERKFVEGALSSDMELRQRYATLKDSDTELRRVYPWGQSALRNLSAPAIPKKRFRMAVGLCAAAAVLAVFGLSFHFFGTRTPNNAGIYVAQESGSDRIKGTELKTELSIYIKETPEEEGGRLPDRTLLKEGNIVQLAYTTPPGDEYYGVIFSIDGRSVVTLHYPYRRQQTPVLTAGRRTFLNEAYILDDAPDCEIFFMVVSQEPLNTNNVLQIAGELAKDPPTALEKSVAAFENCEVETIVIQK